MAHYRKKHNIKLSTNENFVKFSPVTSDLIVACFSGGRWVLVGKNRHVCVVFTGVPRLMGARIGNKCALHWFSKVIR